MQNKLYIWLHSPLCPCVCCRMMPFLDFQSTHRPDYHLQSFGIYFFFGSGPQIEFLTSSGDSVEKMGLFQAPNHWLHHTLHVAPPQFKCCSISYEKPRELILSWLFPSRRQRWVDTASVRSLENFTCIGFTTRMTSIYHRTPAPHLHHSLSWSFNTSLRSQRIANSQLCY